MTQTASASCLTGSGRPGSPIRKDRPVLAFSSSSSSRSQNTDSQSVWKSISIPLEQFDQFEARGKEDDATTLNNGTTNMCYKERGKGLKRGIDNDLDNVSDNSSDSDFISPCQKDSEKE